MSHVSFLCLLVFPHLAILAKVTGKGSSSSRQDDARYNIVISHIYKNTEGRNPIAARNKKIQLVVPANNSSNNSNCRCPNLEINKWVSRSSRFLKSSQLKQQWNKQFLANETWNSWNSLIHRSYLILGKHSKSPRNELQINQRSIVIEWRDEFKGRLEKFKKECY